jgi:type IV pilus assembly protein PilA
MLKSTLTRLREAKGIETGEAADAGFTLIELMVVLLIIAILLAIAIPTFLGVSGSANDRSAQSNLTNALTEVKALYQNSQSYAAASLPAGTLAASAPEFTWSQNVAIATEGSNLVSEAPVDLATAQDGQGVILATYSKTGTCWYVVDLESTPGTATFTDTGFFPFFGSTSAVDGQENGAAALTQGGVYYSQVANPTTNGANPTGTAQTCNATNPMKITSSAQWKWGTSYATAPQF